jgi:hypothetical protein
VACAAARPHGLHGRRHASQTSRSAPCRRAAQPGRDGLDSGQGFLSGFFPVNGKIGTGENSVGPADWLCAGRAIGFAAIWPDDRVVVFTAGKAMLKEKPPWAAWNGPAAAEG